MNIERDWDPDKLIEPDEFKRSKRVERDWDPDKLVEPKSVSTNVVPCFHETIVVM